MNSFYILLGSLVNNIKSSLKIVKNYKLLLMGLFFSQLGLSENKFKSNSKNEFETNFL